MTTFKEKVINTVKGIHKGDTLSYGEVARRAGNPGAARTVGTMMGKNKDKSVPCHRVIKSDGSVGKYNGLRGDKKKLLELEKNEK